MASPPNSYDFSALLSHVSQEEARLGSMNGMDHFGHPPPPSLSMFRLASQTTVAEDCVLILAFTKHCISAQVLTRQSAAMDEGSSKPDSAPASGPFLVSTVPSTNDTQGLIQCQQQHVQEAITGLTIVALEDLSLITATEKIDQVVFEANPKRKLIQVGETTPIGETEQATAKIKNLHLMGYVAEELQFQRLVVIYGTNVSRVLSVELKWNPQKRSIVFPLSEPLEPLPLDPLHLLKKIQEEKQVPFCPLGGVNHLSTFVLVRDRPQYATITSKKMPPPPTAYVWISYSDGTLLRIHHSAFFGSVLGDEVPTKASPGETVFRAATKPSLQERLSMQHIPLLLRCETKIAKKDITSFAIVPMPKYHPSPLAPLPTFKHEKGDTPTAGVLSDKEYKEEDEEEGEAVREVCEAILYTRPTAPPGTAETFPTLCFYTSEDQFLGRVEGHEGLDPSGSSFGDTPILGAVVGGAKALVGVLTWGFGGGTKTAAGPPSDVDKLGEEQNSRSPDGYFPTLRKGRVLKLYAGYEMHDSPRQIESLIIDPDGNLGATTDSFGRVILIDLSTKQVVRMWKGFREASCFWLQVARTSPGTATNSYLPIKKSLFLVIHSRQRRVVEVYRCRHGPRIKSIQVGRDASIVSCKEWTWFKSGRGDYVTNCYIFHSNVPGSYFLEKLEVEGEEESATQEESQKSNPLACPATNPKEAALRLQRLQQLLANTNVPCQLSDVHNALLQIKSLKDLATCLDRLAVASVLESKMGVKGTEFQKTALAYCRESLKDAVKSTTGDPASNPHVKLLATQIVYHTQVINAFDILRRFEQSGSAEEDQQVAPRSPWTEEAMGWVATYEMVNGKKASNDFPDESATVSGTDLLPFATFANACVVPKTPDSPTARDNRKIEVYLSDSSKTRRDVLVHVFKPLLGDIFAFNVVNSIFGALGILEDSEYLLKCFGDWYMTLSTKEAAQKGFYSLYSPMMRWLQEMVTKQLDKKTVDNHELALKSLHSFCSESSDLVKAFMLGALCREAVAKATKIKEEKTYGKILSADKVKKWDHLLRKLRVCLLVSLRLKGVRIGTFPITVEYVEKGDIFSVYEWLAHDELAMTHNHKEITTLEAACMISGISFDPSTEAGDATSRFEMLQNACLSAALSEEERTEYLVDFDDDDKLGALLLFLKSHNEPKLLVAHRALLLASFWSQNPHDLDILANALVALQSLSIRDDLKSLTAAIRLEVWHTSIRPVYRALLFGFHDVQEVSEHIVAPLFQQSAWVKDFGRLALEVLTLLMQITWSKSMNTFQPTLEAASDGETWPAVKPDFMLQRLVERSRQIDRSALDMHRVVIGALRVSDDDIHRLINCIPNFHNCFETASLYQPVSPATNAVVEQQRSFLEDAIISFAQKYSDPVMETLHLGDIETLGAIWKFDMNAARTTFFLAMYEFGKDRLVDELLIKSASRLSVHRMVDEGVDIVCRRLNDLLHSKRRQAPGVREVMSLLDADMCIWIREKAEKSQSIVVFSNLQVPIEITHLFVLRLLSLSQNDQVEKEVRVKIHSLAVLSGQIVKSFEKNSER